jgi:hypothetical protein
MFQKVFAAYSLPSFVHKGDGKIHMGDLENTVIGRARDGE